MKKIAIIGVGPRGLSALESLFSALSKYMEASKTFVTLFETSQFPGAGQVWDINQSNVNWLNISQRALNDLKGRKEIQLNNCIIPSFPGYVDWLPEALKNDQYNDPDLFPPRSQMGKYLNARYNSIAEPLLAKKLIRLVSSTVISINYNKENFRVSTGDDKEHEFDEVVLTIGHQSTKLPKQLKKWKQHVGKHNNLTLFLDAYPVENIGNSKNINSKSIVGIRGFGLAMIDDVRALTIDRGGTFEITDTKTFQSTFKNAKDIPQKIVPFSLDGKPMIPKPLNGKIDELFTPSEKEIDEFSQQIRAHTNSEKQATDITFLKKAIASIVAKQYLRLNNKAYYQFQTQKDCEATILAWLDDEDVKHPAIYPSKSETEILIGDYIEMAVSSSHISLDYCIGQVWRHCQPHMYNLFAHADLPDEVMADIVAIDERIKRYSYGPPVESMQQLLALHRAGILTFDYVDDPEIKLIKNGWKLTAGNKEVIVNCMINSILSPPKLLEVTSPVIKNLLSDDLLQPVHSDLGIKTYSNGCVELPDSKDFISLAVLGRLSKGSILGADAILECFSNQIDDWAEGVVRRMKR